MGRFCISTYTTAYQRVNPNNCYGMQNQANWDCFFFFLQMFIKFALTIVLFGKMGLTCLIQVKKM